MSMVKKLRNPAGKKYFCLGRVAGRATIAAVICLSMAAILPAQTSICPDCPQGVTPPGAIGSQQLQRGGPLVGCFQAVEIRAPKGAMISTAVEGSFDTPQPAPIRVGMVVGPIYRFRVMNIPLAPGVEVFPTIEVVDRTYAPQGQELRFAIPVELTSEELQMAAAGKFVTRVIYVEDPHAAVPVEQDEKHQNWFDVGPGKDPYKVALNLGRPVAVLRMGGRLPDKNPDSMMQFLCGCPPLMHFAAADGHTKSPVPTQSPAPKKAPVQQTPQPKQGLQQKPWIKELIAARPADNTLQPQQQPAAKGPIVSKPLISISEPIENTPAVQPKSNGVHTLPPPPSARQSSIR
ncbi:MAG: hypothetical protein JXM70_18285 [Pirellulales bacterium]|nr:hypothetical protein [Pirellulales bacterium]